jgi:CubicO group peptidase (beta-lactamase class C family)
MINTLLSLFAGLPFVLAMTGGHCPPTGPVLPPPEIPAKFDLSKLNTQLDRLAQNESKSFNSTVNSFSVLLTSSNATFYQYHHAASVRDPSGVKKLDGDAAYRVCSVTKVFNVLTSLLHAGELLDTSVTKYIPELVHNTVYQDITLRMLSSHLSGVPRRGVSASGIEIVSSFFLTYEINLRRAN